MADTSADLRAECAQLGDLCRTLTPAQWQLRSAFYGWTPWDEVAHLCFFDATGLLAVTDADAFHSDTAALNAQLAAGDEMSAIARQRYGHLDGPALLAHWEAASAALTSALAVLDPKARLPWYGPTMSARSFATARLMETWAHGQDVWDVVGRRRPATLRLKHIAHLGVTTFGWSFANRQLPVPDTVPTVELSAPDGSVWRWDGLASLVPLAALAPLAPPASPASPASPPSPPSPAFVRGSAEDFCLVVTQRRHVADTGLQASDGPARQWLGIAQCFAGPPADGPAPGVRKGVTSA